MQKVKMDHLQKWRTFISQKLQKEFLVSNDVEECIAHFVTSCWMEGHTLQNACNMSIAEIELLYGEAYTFYENQRFRESEDMFRILVTLDPFVEKYWFGFAASLQRQGRYEEALKGYGIMAALDEKSPHSYFYASECLEKLDRQDESKQALDFANKLLKSMKICQ